MAVTKLQVIKKTIAHTINYCMSKAEKGLIGGVNLNPYFAKREFEETWIRHNKHEGRRGYHAVQSFKPGETTAEVAHQIGLELAEKVWGKRHQVLVVTHTDKKHIHNHFVINAVSFVDGKKLHIADKQMNKSMIPVSDELCKEYGLSVIEQDKAAALERERYEDKEGSVPHQQQKGDNGQSVNYEKNSEKDNKKTIHKESYRHYGEWLEDHPDVDVRSRLKYDLDYYASQTNHIPDLIQAMETAGYEFKLNREHPSVKPPYGQRYIRLRSLGQKYLLENIVDRIGKPEMLSLSVKPEKFESIWVIYLKRTKPKGTLLNLIKHYQILLNTTNKPIIYPSKQATEAAKRLRAYDNEIMYLRVNNIESIEELNNTLLHLKEDKKSLLNQRNKLYRTKDKMLGYQTKLKEINQLIFSVNENIKIANSINQDFKDLRLDELSKETKENEKELPKEERRER